MAKRGCRRFLTLANDEEVRHARLSVPSGGRFLHCRPCVGARSRTRSRAVAEDEAGNDRAVESYVTLPNQEGLITNRGTLNDLGRAPR